MENTTIKLPFYAKFSFTLVFLISLFYILYIGQEIIIPLLMALLFAILLRPFCAFLHDKLKFPHVIAAMTSVTLFVVLILGILTFISWEIADFGNDWNKIKENFNIHISNLQQYVKENFNISTREQEKYIQSATNDTVKTGKEIIGTTLLSFTDTLVNAMLIPIYMFLILLYRTHYMKFLSKLFNKENQAILVDILCQIKVAVKSYLVGLIIQMVSVATLTSIGYMVAGIKYAVLLGVITGLLNLIPYLGILIAMVISIFATLTGTPDLSMILGVIIVTIIVQLIDNNVLVPLVVSSKVEINAMVSIVGIIIGGAIAGISGMFLAIPIIAILKVIFDRIEPLKPWGYLMGDDLPKTYQWKSLKFTNYNYNFNNQNSETISNQGITDVKNVFTETSTHNTNDEQEK